MAQAAALDDLAQLVQVAEDLPVIAKVKANGLIAPALDGLDPVQAAFLGAPALGALLQDPRPAVIDIAVVELAQIVQTVEFLDDASWELGQPHLELVQVFRQDLLPELGVGLGLGPLLA